MASRTRSPKLQSSTRGGTPRSPTSNIRSSNNGVKPGSGKMSDSSATVKKMLDMASAKKPDGLEVFTAYSQLFAYFWLVNLYMRSGGVLLNLPPLSVVMLIFALASFSGSVPVVLCAHLWSLVFSFHEKPWASDCEHWTAHHDMAFILVVVTTVFGKAKLDGKFNVLRTMSPFECQSIMEQFGSLVRLQMVLWYSGATIWKLNRGFFHPKGSCCAVYFLQLIAAYVPESLQADWLVKLAAWSAPYITILVEGGCALLFAFPGWSTRCGVVLGLLLHFLISITPPPNNIAGYGFALGPRYFCFLPEATAMVLAEIKTTLRSVFTETPSFKGVGALSAAAIAVVASAELSAGWGVFGYIPSKGNVVERDWVISAYAVFILLYSRALYLDATAVASNKQRTKCSLPGKLWWVVFAEGILFVYGALILGVADNGPPKPFAAIRTHGGSNHYFLPTGLLQHLVGDSPTFAGSFLSSEVIRMENTNSSYINAIYPAEKTWFLTPRARELLKLVGHSGRQFTPLGGRIGTPGRVMKNQPGPDFTRYTLPAFELRRLLDEVRQQNESFFMKYTLLSKYDANHIHKAEGRLVQLWEDGKGGKTCTLVDRKAPCGPDELVFLPALGYWTAKLMAFWPHIILPEQSEQSDGHAGYCFGE